MDLATLCLVGAHCGGGRRSDGKTVASVALWPNARGPLPVRVAIWPTLAVSPLDEMEVAEQPESEASSTDTAVVDTNTPPPTLSLFSRIHRWLDLPVFSYN
jgi:hypothetical protein